MKLLLNQMLFIVTLVDCERILVINPTPSYSHQLVIHPIVTELSKRGHDVVFASTHPIGDTRPPNLKEIDLGVPKSFTDIVFSASPRLFNLVIDLLELYVNISDTQLAHPEMQKLIKNESEHFDLVMVEYLAPTMHAFKVRFNCPSIGFLSLPALNCDYRNFGDFDNPVLYPDSYTSNGKTNTFLQRIFSVFVSVIFELHREFVVNPRANEIIRTHFGNMYPDIGETAADTDMLFTVSNVVLNIIRPVTPATVMIGGGIHIKEAKKLPTNIQTFLDNSKNGTIYMSFGSNVKSSKLSPHVKQMFLKSFSELPYDFLWKFEDVNLLNKPKNVLIMKWFPQQDILRHKNIKLFITQAGLQSSEEALYNQIPMLAVPFFADQEYNSRQIVKKKIGLMIENFNALTCSQFKDTITELLGNPIYLENVRRFGQIVKDEPMKPIEKAIWWTEYVLRHKGAKHLKGSTVPFYQCYLFDVFALFMLLIVLLAFCIFKFLKYLYSLSKFKNYEVMKKFKIH